MTGRPISFVRPPHTCTEHKPGTRACYGRHACRCDDCARENTRAVKRSTAGHRRRVPAHVIVDHLTRLGYPHVNAVDVEHATGVPEATIRTIMAGRVQSVQASTASRLLACQYAQPGDSGLMPACGVIRRLQSLAVLGWTHAEIAARMGVTRRAVEHLYNADPDGVMLRATWAKVDRVWRELQATPRTVERADRVRRRAEARGWLPPLAWDEDMGPHGIDNPHARPVKNWRRGQWKKAA